MSEIALTFIKQHQVECVVVAFVCVIILNVIFLVYLVKSGGEESTKEGAVVKEETEPEEQVEKKPSDTIVVDMSGAVVNPGAYTLSESARLSHVLTEAGGLSKVADKDFFARNYNSAARLTDQQKIYVPRIDEIESGIFVENAYSIDHAVCVYGEGALSEDGAAADENSNGFSVNSASEQELDSLPGVGPVTAKKIIDGRPYESLDKLVELKILSQKAFDEIHDRLKL
jgi:competence protein ComEA